MICFTCKNEFEKRAHNQIYCSVNCKAKGFRLKNPDARNKIEHKYYESHRDICVQRVIDYQNRNPDKIKKIDRKYRRSYLKRNLQQHERALIRTRTYKKIIFNEDSFCIKCGSNENLQRHHPNYDKPDYVIILCRFCHQQYHRQQNLKKVNVVWIKTKCLSG